MSNIVHKVKDAVTGHHGSKSGGNEGSNEYSDCE